MSPLLHDCVSKDRLRGLPYEPLGRCQQVSRAKTKTVSPIPGLYLTPPPPRPTPPLLQVASHAQKHFIRLAMSGTPLPPKVAASGPGYTLSGNLLDPTSAAAAAYGFSYSKLLERESTSDLVCTSVHMYLCTCLCAQTAGIVDLGSCCSLLVCQRREASLCVDQEGGGGRGGGYATGGGSGWGRGGCIEWWRFGWWSYGQGILALVFSYMKAAVCKNCSGYTTNNHPSTPNPGVLCVGVQGEQLATALSGILPVDEDQAAAAAAAGGEDSGATRDQKVGAAVTTHSSMAAQHTTPATSAFDLCDSITIV